MLFGKLYVYVKLRYSIFKSSREYILHVKHLNKIISFLNLNRIVFRYIIYTAFSCWGFLWIWAGTTFSWYINRLSAYISGEVCLSKNVNLPSLLPSVLALVFCASSSQFCQVSSRIDPLPIYWEDPQSPDHCSEYLHFYTAISVSFVLNDTFNKLLRTISTLQHKRLCLAAVYSLLISKELYLEPCVPTRTGINQEIFNKSFKI